jgi:membrane protein implicated in regulation of membrane protease activity
MIVIGLFLMPMIFFGVGLACVYAGLPNQAAALFKLSFAGWLVVLAFGCWGWLRKSETSPKDIDTPY